jgi:hypothetical protein
MSCSMASRTARARTSLRLIPVMTVSGSIMEVATRRHTRGAPEQKLDGAPCRAQAGWSGQSMKAPPRVPFDRIAAASLELLISVPSHEHDRLTGCVHFVPRSDGVHDC